MPSPTLLHHLHRECRSPDGFAPEPLDTIWADIERIRSWAKCDEYPLTKREFLAQVRELEAAGLVVVEDGTVCPVAGAEVVPAGMMF